MPCDSSITSVLGLYESPRMPAVPFSGNRDRINSANRGTWRGFIASVASASSAGTPLARANAEKATLSLGKHGPPYPRAPFKYFEPMRLSHPIASVTTSTSAPGNVSQTCASMLAYEIFVVTNVFTESFVNSALTKFIRRMRGLQIGRAHV